MMPASGVQLARRHVQQHRAGRVNLWLGDLPGAAQPALPLVELARPDRPEGKRPQRGREYRPIAQAIALGQGHRLTPPFARGRERDKPCRENLVSATRDLQVRPADRLGERSSLREVPLGIVESPGPRLGDPEIQQRDSPQLTTHRGRFVRFVGDRGIEKVHLLDHFRELTAAPRQRQPQGSDGHRQTAAASRWRALDVGLGQRQLSDRFLQPALVQFVCRVSQRQVGMIGGCTLRKRPEHRADRSRLPIEHPPERVVSDQPGSLRPVASRDRVAHSLDDVPVISEPPRGAAV